MHAQTLLPLLSLLVLPTVSFASPNPSFVSDEYMHLMPRNVLFFRQATNIQSFTSNLGGFGTASAITKTANDSKRPFTVSGDTFTDFASAGQRSCDNQFQDCSQGANKDGNKGNITVKDCEDQKSNCTTTQKTAKVQDFSTATATTNIGPDPDFPDFDLICDA